MGWWRRAGRGEEEECLPPPLRALPAKRKAHRAGRSQCRVPSLIAVLLLPPWFPHCQQTLSTLSSDTVPLTRMRGGSQTDHGTFNEPLVLEPGALASARLGDSDI